MYFYRWVTLALLLVREHRGKQCQSNDQIIQVQAEQSKTKTAFDIPQRTSSEVTADRLN